MSSIFNWFSPPKKRQTHDDLDELQLDMLTTANCRYSAAARLQTQGKLAFNATTVLSLGLVFIPLMQNSGVCITFRDSVLNLIQIFLGVAVLVYSLIIGTARYDVRALQLLQCADKIKDIIRETKVEAKKNPGLSQNQYIEAAHKKYSEALSISENHERIDYHISMLSTPQDYIIPAGTRMIIRIQRFYFDAKSLIAPGILIAFLSIFTMEMFGITEITRNVLPSWHEQLCPKGKT
jgi:hypothetical protein